MILELFDFNYNQIGVDYEFKKLFLSYFDEKDFLNWKIVTNLETLVAGCSEPERIVNDFYNLAEADDNYSFLSVLGYTRYDLEEGEYYGKSKLEVLHDIQIESEELLTEIKEWLNKTCNVDLSCFEDKRKETLEVVDSNISIENFAISSNSLFDTSKNERSNKWLLLLRLIIW